MGRIALQWSPIQLRMENQHKIILMGRLHGVKVDIEDASTLDDFEVIEMLMTTIHTPCSLELIGLST